MGPPHGTAGSVSPARVSLPRPLRPHVRRSHHDDSPPSPPQPGTHGLPSGGEQEQGCAPLQADPRTRWQAGQGGGTDLHRGRIQRTPRTPAEQVERHDCPKCQAPAGSPCRTGAGKVAANYHTGRFALVPALKAELTVKTPADRNPGKAWTQGALVAQTPDAIPGAAIRLGYAR
ncbi:zinc finger domain-containing protein [Streptomyces flavovirens]|uniref:zinc finger domain-containing protein n=1 Tax=Streptomyces flavovirens TaxID=52258 RepID=UPI003D0E3521